MQADIRADVRTALVFGAAAATLRSNLWSVQTRDQMIAVILLAALYHWSHPRGRVRGFVLSAVCIVIGMLYVRWGLEGLCPHHFEPFCLARSSSFS